MHAASQVAADYIGQGAGGCRLWDHDELTVVVHVVGALLGNCLLWIFSFYLRNIAQTIQLQQHQLTLHAYCKRLLLSSNIWRARSKILCKGSVINIIIRIDQRMLPVPVAVVALILSHPACCEL